MRQRQLTFDFTDGGVRTPEPLQCDQRRNASAKLRQVETNAAIRGLIARGQLFSGAHLRQIPLVTFIRNRRVQWIHFLDAIISGTVRRGDEQETLQLQNDVLALRNDFDALSDLDAALRLQALGFCGSTKRYHGTLKEDKRILLLEFRRHMEKYEKANSMEHAS